VERAVDQEEVRRALAATLPGEGRHVFGPEEMAKVMVALRAGATLENAAAAAGFTSGTVRRARRRSPDFHDGCVQAIAAAHERLKRPATRAPIPARQGFAYGRGKPLLFDADRKKAFLEHYAATLDIHAAAEAAGVAYRTVCNHRRDDPDFAAACIEARDIGVERITDELARQRLAAAERYRVDGDKIVPEAAVEFERAIRFLQIYRAQQARARAEPPPAKWSFEETMKSIEAGLAVYRLRREREKKEGLDDETD
jgi:hypothetical protein